MSELYTVQDPRFQRYGRVINGYQVEDICEAAGRIPMPGEGVAYERSIPALEATETFRKLEKWFGGEARWQGGLCWGDNHKMNAVEYHRSSEINIAVTDMVLMLGDRRDVRDNRYDASKLEFFQIPKGTVVELYATTLHFAPCTVNPAGFRAIVILPQGTNAPLSAETKKAVSSAKGEDRLLFARDKWMIAHADCGDAQNDIAFVGISGENPEYQG